MVLVNSFTARTGADLKQYCSFLAFWMIICHGGMHAPALYSMDLACYMCEHVDHYHDNDTQDKAEQPVFDGRFGVQNDKGCIQG